MAVDPDRLRVLHEAKLRALVLDQCAAGPAPELTALEVAGGAALRAGTELWVYAPGGTERALGRCLVLAARHQPSVTHLVLDSPSGRDARRASLLAIAVRVWHVAGSSVAATPPTPLDSPADPPSGSAAELISLLEAAGVDVVVEHGVIVGEVLGLEVARVSIGADGLAGLDVGVGRFDQEATALLHADMPTADALVRAASLVREHRQPGAAPHAVNRLARERWLRTQVVAAPHLAGVTSLNPISPPEPRRNVKDPAPAAALGHDSAGAAVLVVCTVGVDVDWVPFAADLVERERPGRIVVVLPPRDQLPIQERLAALLPVPVGFVALDGAWP